MTSEMKQAIWDILVREAGATDNHSNREGFFGSFPQCREYRFMGSLGFGGKVWYQTYHNPPVDVDCYLEDLTPERIEIINRTNAELAKLDYGKQVLR